MAEQQKAEEAEPKKHGVTGWLKLKFLGGGKKASPVDNKFLDDISDVDTIDRYQIIKKVGQGSMGAVSYTHLRAHET